MTIDQVYSMIVRSARDMTDDKKREAYLQKAREHYYQRDQAKLQSMLSSSKGTGMCGEGLYGAGMCGSGFKPKNISQRKYMEADGMPDPSIYNYFSDFDSPLKQTRPPMAKAYPLYNQFGAYNG